MKQERLKKFLAAEAVVCALAAAGLWLWEGAAFSLVDLPAGALGRALTALAGTGRVGFALALTVYAFFALLPLYCLARIRARRKLTLEDALLGGVSLAAALALFPRGWVSYWETAVSQTMFTRIAWQLLALSLLLGWCVLRLLRRIREGDARSLLRMFRALLGVCAALFVFSVSFVELLQLFSAIDTLSSGNTALTGSSTFSGVFSSYNDVGALRLPLSYAILTLRFFADALPTLLAAATAFLARALLDTMDENGFTEKSAACAPKLAFWCARALKLSVLATLAVNALQALGAKYLLDINISIEMPVFSLCFVLAALLGARLIEANVALKADNDLFI